MSLGKNNYDIKSVKYGIVVFIFKEVPVLKRYMISF